MTPTKLLLLGTPHVEVDGQNVDLGLRKAMALVAYLAVTKRSHSRDFLAGFLWPEDDQITARSNLRRTLYRLQHALGQSLLLVSPEALAISPMVDLWLDVMAFDRHVADCPPSGSQYEVLNPECKARLEEATNLYRDDFMTGFFLPDSAAFEEWQFFERERLQRELAKILVVLARTHLAEGNPATAIPFARRWLGLDPLHEPAHRMLIELYSRSGQQSAALRQYHECARLLKESLGVPPEPETTQLYNSILKGREAWHIHKAKRPLEINYVHSGDVHIAYQVLGSGPVDILMVSGFISHLEYMWEGPGVTQGLEGIASFSRLILFDKRGIGLSDRVGYPPTLEHTMDDIRSVMDAVGSQQAVLFGFSEGGPNSLLFSATYPERVLGLVLYGTMAKGSRTPDYPWALTEEQLDKWVQNLLSAWGKPVPLAYFAPSYAEDNDVWAWFAKLLRLGSSPGEVQGVLEVMQDIDVRNILPVISVPTLILHRVDDRVLRVGGGRYLAEHIPGAHYIEMPGQDHLWWLGDTQLVIDEIRNFVTKLKPAVSIERRLFTILSLGVSPGMSSSHERSHPPTELIQSEIGRFNGKHLMSNGDMFIAAFDGPSRAIQCGLALRQVTAQSRLTFRIVLHTGECIVSDNELSGSAVEIAKAMVTAAIPGEVTVSRTVKDLVVGAGFSFDERNAHLRSEKYGTWELYKVS